MKKISTLLILLTSYYYLKAQTILTTQSNYQSLKASGQLMSNINYKFIDNSSSSNQITNSSTNVELRTANTSSNAACQCLIPIDPTFSVVPFTSGTPPDYRCDDGSSNAIPLGFNFCFYGTNYTNCYINNNGNISFGTSYSAFSSNPFPNTNFVMIAPFWADVDTRNSASGIVYYKQTPTALIVKWSGVGYYNSSANLVNDFQLIISNSNDSLIPNNNNVSFCYGDMQWTTGNASMGVGGFGGTPATVGINKGDGIDYFQIGQFSAPGTGYNGPYNAIDSIDVIDNMQFVFNTCNTSNLAPFTTANVCDTTVVSPFQIITGEVYVYAPEITQTVTVNYTEQAFKSNSNAFSILNTESVLGGAIIHYQFDASQVAPGSRIVANITGSDNYGSPANYSRSLYFKVQNMPTNITEEQFSEKPYAFPNPASTNLYISNSPEPLSLKLFDIYGNLVLEKIFDTIDKKSLSIDYMSSGCYFAKIYSNQKLIRNQKIIINH